MIGSGTVLALGITALAAGVSGGLMQESLFGARMAAVVFCISALLAVAGLSLNLVRYWTDYKYQRWLNTPE